jgi:hypothetical protein
MPVATIYLAPWSRGPRYLSNPSGVARADRQGLRRFGGTAPLRWVIAGGARPDGITLDEKSTGELTGTPNAAGQFTFSVQVTDAGGASAARRLSLQIGEARGRVAASRTSRSVIP